MLISSTCSQILFLLLGGAVADRQSVVPDALLARMNAFNSLVQLLPVPIGYAVAGPLADAFGVQPVLLAAAGVALVSAVAPLAWHEVRLLGW